MAARPPDPARGLSLHDVIDDAAVEHLRASDDTLFAIVTGVVKFEWAKRGKKQISVYPAAK